MSATIILLKNTTLNFLLFRSARWKQGEDFQKSCAGVVGTQIDSRWFWCVFFFLEHLPAPARHEPEEAYPSPFGP